MLQDGGIFQHLFCKSLKFNWFKRCRSTPVQLCNLEDVHGCVFFFLIYAKLHARSCHLTHCSMQYFMYHAILMTFCVMNIIETDLYKKMLLNMNYTLCLCFNKIHFCKYTLKYQSLHQCVFYTLPNIVYNVSGYIVFSCSCVVGVKLF